MPNKIHRLVQRGDFAQLREALNSGTSDLTQEINQFDEDGCTPLMRAVESPAANVEIVKLLLAHGADIRQEMQRKGYRSRSVVDLSLGGGNPEIVRLLLQHGADIHYPGVKGYGALISAVYSRDILRDAQLIELLELLIAQGVELNGITEHEESALKRLSDVGRFDAIKLLLDAGADPTHLRWTPLLRAVALGSLDEVKSEVTAGASLEDKDGRERTSWLLALQTGDVSKATFLYENGANTSARGRCDKPPLFYAVESGSLAMLRWVLEIGADVEQTNDSGRTSLMEAVEHNNLEAVEELIKAGANLQSECYGETALSSIKQSEIGFRLLAAGADPRQLSFEARRVLLGLNPDTSNAWLDVTEEEYREGRSRRFGISNPEQSHSKFCEEMVRTGITAYLAANAFQDSLGTGSPVWCAKRFGQSITFMPDGRAIQIAGEHEDYYDPDFCIYNDVFVHHPNGAINIFNYPLEVFAPTDFHTASLLGERYIWIIGSLGYAGTRRYGQTPVCRLDTSSMQIEQIETVGESPGWIYDHTASVLSTHEIKISVGKIVTKPAANEVHSENSQIFIFDTEKRAWSHEPTTFST